VLDGSCRQCVRVLCVVDLGGRLCANMFACLPPHAHGQPIAWHSLAHMTTRFAFSLLSLPACIMAAVMYPCILYPEP
jgi:hypothetical protein